MANAPYGNGEKASLNGSPSARHLATRIEPTRELGRLPVALSRAVVAASYEYLRERERMARAAIQLRELTGVAFDIEEIRATGCTPRVTGRLTVDPRDLLQFLEEALPDDPDDEIDWDDEDEVDWS